MSSPCLAIGNRSQRMLHTFYLLGVDMVNSFYFVLLLFCTYHVVTFSLTKDIGLEDLSEDDLHALHSGYASILPKKDSTGRAVLLNSSRYATCNTWENQVSYSILYFTIHYLGLL